MTGISKSKYTDPNGSRFDVISESPTKTDKSFIIMDNRSNSKQTDLSEINKILGRIDETEKKSKKSHFQGVRKRTPISTMDRFENLGNKLSILDKNHPMNLSVSSLNSVTKSRSSKPSHSFTPNADLKSKLSLTAIL